MVGDQTPEVVLAVHVSIPTGSTAVGIQVCMDLDNSPSSCPEAGEISLSTKITLVAYLIQGNEMMGRIGLLGPMRATLELNRADPSPVVG